MASSNAVATASVAPVNTFDDPVATASEAPVTSYAAPVATATVAPVTSVPARCMTATTEAPMVFEEDEVEFMDNYDLEDDGADSSEPPPLAESLVADRERLMAVLCDAIGYDAALLYGTPFSTGTARDHNEDSEDRNEESDNTLPMDGHAEHDNVSHRSSGMDEFDDDDNGGGDEDEDDEDEYDSDQTLTMYGDID